MYRFARRAALGHAGCNGGSKPRRFAVKLPSMETASMLRDHLETSALLPAAFARVAAAQACAASKAKKQPLI
ncbi:hypothetical protein GCT13_29980 [Paraburkholderia sp. CNPSo 3157]|uniref:Uncharacterized protein n=1 Tax=Paraburkholderia franconis TaxID=2654983 RepID=A0A7X1NG97_9BURK|nr:hypothetical protein [Paraburkholderia franconis]MPW20986.1 hypothetical protein [Paraburkholderia franconis]